MALNWALHDVCPSSLCVGDHIYRYSSMVHVHHGIVLEVPDDSRDLFDRIVVLEIPNINGAEAKQETLGTFLGRSKINGGCSLKSARYGVPPIEVWVKRRGTCYVEHSSPVNEVLARAYSLLQKTEQNPSPAVRRATSEDLAFWCKTGKSRSAVPNNIGGTNYRQAYPQPTSSLEATRATEVTAPQATDTLAEANHKSETLVVHALDEDDTSSAEDEFFPDIPDLDSMHVEEVPNTNDRMVDSPSSSTSPRSASEVLAEKLTDKSIKLEGSAEALSLPSAELVEAPSKSEASKETETLAEACNHSETIVEIPSTHDKVVEPSSSSTNSLSPAREPTQIPNAKQEQDGEKFFGQDTLELLAEFDELCTRDDMPVTKLASKPSGQDGDDLATFSPPDSPALGPAPDKCGLHDLPETARQDIIDGKAPPISKRWHNTNSTERDDQTDSGRRPSTGSDEYLSVGSEGHQSEDSIRKDKQLRPDERSFHDSLVAFIHSGIDSGAPPAGQWHQTNATEGDDQTASDRRPSLGSNEQLSAGSEGRLSREVSEIEHADLGTSQINISAPVNYKRDKLVLGFKGNAAARWAETRRQEAAQASERCPHRLLPKKASEGNAVATRSVKYEFEVQSINASKPDSSLKGTPEGSPHDSLQNSDEEDKSPFHVSRSSNQRAQFSRDEHLVACWISEVTGHKCVCSTAAGRMPLQAALSSGEALCDLVVKVWPDKAPKVVHRGTTVTFRFRCLENISYFLQACREIGMHEQELFSVVDLADGKGMPTVVQCLHALANLVPDTWNGPRLHREDRENEA